MKRRKGTGIFCIILMLMLAATMTFGSVSSVQAAKTITANKNWKKAKIIKKKGTYNINSKSKTGYIRFVAPKTATYTITMYNIREWGKKSSDTKFVGQFYVNKRNKKYDFLDPMMLKTNYGKAQVFPLASLKLTTWWGEIQRKDANICLYKRYAKVKLKKGAAVYIQPYMQVNKFQCTLNIK